MDLVVWVHCIDFSVGVVDSIGMAIDAVGHVASLVNRAGRHADNSDSSAEYGVRIHSTQHKR